jgi:hypothetical protein
VLCPPQDYGSQEPSGDEAGDSQAADEADQGADHDQGQFIGGWPAALQESAHRHDGRAQYARGVYILHGINYGA